MTHWTFDQSEFGSVLQKRGVRIGGICHVGAHEGQEVEFYEALGFDPIVLVEAEPTLAAGLVEKFGDRVEVKAVAAGEGKFATLHIVERDTQYNSLLPPIALGKTTAVNVPVQPLHELIDGRVNVLVVDTQGTELDVMRTAPMEQLDLVVLEIGTRQKYRSQPVGNAVKRFMKHLGWTPVYEWPHGPRAIWFDVAFMRG